MKTINKSKHLLLLNCCPYTHTHTLPPHWHPCLHIQLVTTGEPAPVSPIGPPSVPTDRDSYISSLFLKSICFIFSSSLPPSLPSSLPSFLPFFLSCFLPSTNTQRTWRNTNHSSYVPGGERDSTQVIVQKVFMSVRNVDNGALSTPMLYDPFQVRHFSWPPLLTGQNAKPFA